MKENMTEEGIKMKMDEIIEFVRLSRKYIKDKNMLKEFYKKLPSQIPIKTLHY